MNFVLFENENGKETFMWEKELENLPNSTIAFTHYQQDNIDENGMIQSCEYRIGVPVKFIIGDMYIQLKSDTSNNQKDNIYCLYTENKIRKFKPINSNTTLVNTYLELEEIFATIIKKEQIKKR